MGLGRLVVLRELKRVQWLEGARPGFGFVPPAVALELVGRRQ